MSSPQRLADANLDLAFGAARFHGGNRDVAPEDLVGIAYLSLRRAAELWDGTRPFRRFASSHVTGGIRHAFRDSSQVPGHAYESGARMPDVLESQVVPEEGQKLKELAAPACNQDLRILLEEALRLLTERQRDVFLRRAQGYTWPEIGRVHGVGRSGALLIHKSARAVLLQHMAPMFPEYL